MKIAIIDYGMGNIHSVAKAVALFGAETVITNKKSEINSIYLFSFEYKFWEKKKIEQVVFDIF